MKGNSPYEIIEGYLRRLVITQTYTIHAGLPAALAGHILNDLHRIGWLLPLGGTVLEERGQYLSYEDRIASIGLPRDAGAYRVPIPYTHTRRIISWHVEGRPNDEWPRYVGPWEPVAEQGTYLQPGTGGLPLTKGTRGLTGYNTGASA